MRTKAAFLAAALTAVAGCGGSDGKPLPPRVRIGGYAWNVEVVADPASRARGMGGRKQVPPGTGMLFVFPREAPVEFHMLDCHVPLDVAFIDSAGTIREIRTMYVEADPADPQVLYPSRAPVKYALEVAAGAFKRFGIKPGDSVELSEAARGAAKDAR